MKSASALAIFFFALPAWADDALTEEDRKQSVEAVVNRLPEAKKQAELRIKFAEKELAERQIGMRQVAPGVLAPYVNQKLKAALQDRVKQAKEDLASLSRDPSLAATNVSLSNKPGDTFKISAQPTKFIRTVDEFDAFVEVDTNAPRAEDDIKAQLAYLLIKGHGKDRDLPKPGSKITVFGVYRAVASTEIDKKHVLVVRRVYFKEGELPIKEVKPLPKPTASVDSASQLELARGLIAAGKIDKAKEKLQKIISDYPDTTAAKDAREILKKIKD